MNPSTTSQTDENTVIKVFIVVWNISFELSPISEVSQAMTVSYVKSIVSGSKGRFKLMIHSRIVFVRLSIYLSALLMNP